MQLPDWLRRALLFLALCALALLAHGRLLAAGLLPHDHLVLARAGEGPGASDDPAQPSPLLALRTADLLRVDARGDEPGWPLSGLSLALSRRLYGLPDESGAAPVGYRLENLLLLALAAVGLHRFLRRFLMPWVGSEQAADAARTAAAVLLVHPLTPAVVVSLSARADLLAAVFGTFAAAAFLRGRQDRNAWMTAVAVVLALLAALSGELGLSLPVLLAASEYLSSHRYRKRRERLRTTGTTALVYGGAAALGAALRMVEGGGAVAPRLHATLRALGEPGRAQEIGLVAVEKLGVLVLPAGTNGSTLLASALAALLFLFAVQPALLAARSAPRLWGWLVLGFFGALVVAGFPGAEVRVHPGRLGPAAVLFPAVLCASSALALASTSVSGVARRVRPAVLALGFAVLAHANAKPFAEAGRYAVELGRDLAEARVLHGWQSELLLVDPLRPVRGVDAVDDDLAALLHPAFAGEAARAAGPLRALTERAFLALARERELEALRRGSLLVVFPAERPRSARATSRVGPPRQSVLLPPPEPSGAPLSWRRETRSPDLDLETLGIGALRVTAPVGALPEGPLVASWRGLAPLDLPASAQGPWWRSAPSPEAAIDLSSSLAWRLSGRVRRVWFESAPATLAQAELLPDLPPLAAGAPLQPAAQEGDWTFALAPPALPEGLWSTVAALGERATWRVTLLDLQDFACFELPGELAPAGALLVRGATARVRECVLRTGGPVAWTLDLLVDGRAVARAHGRRIGRGGSREE